MKKLTSFIIAFIMLLTPAFAAEFSGEIDCKSAILMESSTGRVLYEKNADDRSLIASTTKIMTALVVCEHCNVLDRMRIPKEAVGIEGSSMYLQEGEVLTILELLYGLMLHSGNDAAVALAIYCAGTVEGFAEMMNDKARALGLRNTNFENPNGLDSPNHYSTAKDLAILASKAMENPIFAKIVSTKTVKVGQRYLRNHNKLLWQLEGADGVKTGYTKAAGRILVSSANRGGRRLVAVTISDPNDWQDHAELLESGFHQYSPKVIVSENDILGTVEVAGGTCESVQLIAGESFSFSLAQDEHTQVRLPSPGFVYAPVCAGQDAGYAQIYLGETLIGRIPVCYGQTVEKDAQENPGLWERLLGGSNR